MAISSALGSSALLPAGLGFRNKIINGDMRINQRATTVTGASTVQYCTDRWAVYNSVGTVTFQQSTVAPAGYINSLLATVTGTGSYSTSNYTLVGQFIEGSNIADLAWGTSSAKPITISFWVRSSVTGTYTVSLQNDGQNRSYVATYTINSANTWEQKFITVQGETTGSWATNNSTGLRVWFTLGLGTQWDTTPNTWQNTNVYSVSSSVDFAANSGATFYLTGVQVEQNYQPTPFEQRPIGVELALCQRYYEKSYNINVAIGTATNENATVHYYPSFSGYHRATAYFKVTKRASPTVRAYSTTTGAADRILLDGYGDVTYGAGIGTNSFHAGVGIVTANGINFQWTADSEL